MHFDKLDRRLFEKRGWIVVLPHGCRGSWVFFEPDKVCVCVYVCMCVRVYVCMCVCVCVCVCL